MEWLDAREVLEDEAALRAAEDLQRATHEWWRFTATSVLELRPTVQEQELATEAVGLLRETERECTTHDEPSGIPWRAPTVSGPPKDGRPGMATRG